MKKQRMTRAICAIGLVLALLATIGGMTACKTEEPEARYNTLVYTEQGGAKLVIESGGELEVQSGGTIDIQSGATVDMGGGIDLDGSELILDADADTSLTASTDNQIDMEIGNADEFIFKPDELDVTLAQIINIGNAGTDFDSSGGLTLAAPLVNAAGTYTLPQITWTGDLDSGFYHVAANNIGVSIGGALSYDFNATEFDVNDLLILNIGDSGTDFRSDGGLTLAGEVLGPSGTYTDPTFAFSTDTNTGFYRVGSDNIGVSIGGALDFDFGANDLDFNTSIATNIGSNDTDFRTDGGLTLAGEIIHAAGTYTLPQITFTGDPDSGLYHVGANNIGVSIGGALAYDFNATEFDVNDLLILNIGDSGTDFSGSGGLTLADALAVTAGGITVSDGDVTVADDLIITKQTAITVTTAAFAPTGTYQPIQSAGTVTPTVTIGTAGQLLVLINVAGQDIIIEDTGTTMLTGDITLQQYDSLTLWCDGTNWIMITTSNN